MIHHHEMQLNSRSVKTIINPHPRLNMIKATQASNKTTSQILNKDFPSQKQISTKDITSPPKQTLKNAINQLRAERTKVFQRRGEQNVTSTTGRKVGSKSEGVERADGSEIIGWGRITAISDLMRTGQGRGNRGPEMGRRERREPSSRNPQHLRRGTIEAFRGEK